MKRVLAPTFLFASLLVLGACQGAGSASPTPAPSTADVAEPLELPAHPPGSPAAEEEQGWIVYQAVFGGVVDLGLVRPDGSEGHRIPGGPGNRWHPDWSPDGMQLAYDWNLPTDVSEIAIMSIDGSEERSLIECVDPCLGNGGPAWSPDGQTIGFDGAEGPTAEHESGLCYLALLDLDSGEVRRILEYPDCFAGGGGSAITEAAFMQFSPDGHQIAFQGGGSQGTAIFTATVAGGDVRQLTEWGLGARPHWSPDGEWIVFMSAEPETDRGVPISVLRIRPDGTDLAQLTAPAGTIIDLYPRWLPDGSGILFSRCPRVGASDCESRIVSGDGASDRLLHRSADRQVVHVIWQPPGQPETD